MMKIIRSAVVLFSGGIDSTTALYWARSKAEKVSALTIDYGQRHRVEIRLSGRITEGIGVPQKIIRIDLRQLGGSALTDPAIPLPEYNSVEDLAGGVPATYVPFRNGIFLSLAAAWADVISSEAIVCGFNVIDSPDYPDTRKPFVRAVEKAVNLGTRASESGKNIQILAPFIDLSKARIIEEGLRLGADYSYSISCYAGVEIPCGRCSSCLLRKKAWAEAGAEDHLLQRLGKEGCHELDS
jgi:7-cyano-7-deazaguanine synthase